MITKIYAVYNTESDNSITNVELVTTKWSKVVSWLTLLADNGEIYIDCNYDYFIEQLNKEPISVDWINLHMDYARIEEWYDIDND